LRGANNGKSPQVANVDERVPIQECSFAPYAASKAVAENILLAGNGLRRGLETVALRPPMIWGAGMPMLDRMVEVVNSGNWQWPDKGTQVMCTCHINNLIDAMLLAADRGQGAYFVTDTELGTLKSVVGDLLATRGVKATDKSVPFEMAWMIAGIMGFFWNLFRLKGEPPITRQMLRMIGKPFTLNIDKARRSQRTREESPEERIFRVLAGERRYEDSQWLLPSGYVPFSCWLPTRSLVPDTRSLRPMLIQGVFEHWGHLKYCSNSVCSTPYFIAKRRDQVVCNAEICKAERQRQHVLKWWNENRAKKNQTQGKPVGKLTRKGKGSGKNVTRKAR
jgi:hypothetical protein